MICDKLKQSGLLILLFPFLILFWNQCDQINFGRCYYLVKLEHFMPKSRFLVSMQVLVHNNLLDFSRFIFKHSF